MADRFGFGRAAPDSKALCGPFAPISLEHFGTMHHASLYSMHIAHASMFVQTDLLPAHKLGWGGVGWGVIAFVTTARHDVKLRYAFVTTARHDVMLRCAFVTTARHDVMLRYGVGWGGV